MIPLGKCLLPNQDIQSGFACSKKYFKKWNFLPKILEHIKNNYILRQDSLIFQNSSNNIIFNDSTNNNSIWLFIF